jgi:hypothetical protein
VAFDDPAESPNLRVGSFDRHLVPSPLPSQSPTGSPPVHKRFQVGVAGPHHLVLVLASHEIDVMVDRGGLGRSKCSCEFEFLGNAASEAEVRAAFERAADRAEARFGVRPSWWNDWWEGVPDGIPVWFWRTAMAAELDRFIDPLQT